MRGLKKKNLTKIMAVSLAAVMTLSMAACGSSETATDSASVETAQTETKTEEAVKEPETKEETEASEKVEASIDFEDGLYGFAGIDKSVNSAGDDSILSVDDFNGSKALKAETQGKAAYVGLQMDALLGDKISDVKTVEMSIGIENPDGQFYSASGKVYGFVGEDNAKTSADWSVYLENVNPKTVTYTIDDAITPTEGNYIVVSVETDTGKDKGNSPVILYIDDIVFKDASGNVLEADTSAEYVAADTGNDRSNLCGLTDVVEFEGFATKGDGWSQAGFAMTDDIINALVPGSVVEITYSSENGDIWIVMNEAEAGWMRVGQGNADGSGSDSAYINNSKTTAQITYEQIAALCGDDVSKWGSTMQCEASGAWEVYSVKVGTKAPNYTLADAVEFEGFATKGDGWSQAGFAMTDDIINALVPGSVVEITYSSENGDIWIVMNEAEAGWMRVGQGNADGSGSDSGVFDGSKCYITYEQIAALCGDDVSKWGSTMQCEASGAWEVYGVRVGTAKEFKMLNNLVEFEGFATKGDGWSQAGFAMTDDIINALVPGSVVEITYSSDNGDIWIVMNEAAAGWSRVGQGNADGSGSDSAAFDGTTCQVTYEQIAAICGDDVSTWGSTMQCEASGAWEVYSVSVGTALE
jgi:hypothetical protein